MTTTLVILLPYSSPNSTLTPCSKTMSRGIPAESSRSRSACSPGGTVPLNAVLITPILFAIIALRM